MNNNTAKTLARYASKIGKNYRVLKREWNLMNRHQRTESRQEMIAALERVYAEPVAVPEKKTQLKKAANKPEVVVADSEVVSEAVDAVAVPEKKTQSKKAANKPEVVVAESEVISEAVEAEDTEVVS